MSERAKLKIEGLSLSFGDLHALVDINMEVRGREVLAVIGPNGSGKTCLLNCITGFYRPQKGRISFDGQQVTKLPPHKITKLGIARTFQGIELFTGLSTVDNLLAARHLFFNSVAMGAPAGAIYFGPGHNEEIRHRKVVEDIINFLEIESERHKVVGMLPYGMRKRVDLGRALALEPKLLLLDEPMAGMNLEEKEDMARFILDVSEERRIPIVLVEHDMGVVMDIAQRIVVFDFGHQIAEGTPVEIKRNPAVVKAYLGAEA